MDIYIMTKWILTCCLKSLTSSYEITKSIWQGMKLRNLLLLCLIIDLFNCNFQLSLTPPSSWYGCPQSLVP